MLITKKTVTVLLFLSFVLFIPVHGATGPGGLTKKDAAFLKEAINIQSSIGKRIWPDWDASKAPILYKTADTDYLINHPNPPKDFFRFYDAVLKDTVMVRPNKDKYEYKASFPVGGIMSVVVTAPKETDEPCQWILMVCHEMFHVFQGMKRIINPFTGPYMNCHELSFPFEYTKTGFQEASRIEAELLFNTSVALVVSPDESLILKKVFRNTQVLFAMLTADSLHYKYKQWMEWSEGTARYTEYRIAEIAGCKEKYTPSDEFAREFRNADYAQLFRDRYSNYITNARFSGEKARDRMMFYNAGMAKAFVLDKISPEWKKSYSVKTLDSLLCE
jgi:hypothetical protein